MTSWLTILLTVVQILMGVILTFGMFILTGLREDLKEIAESFESLQREVLKDAMPKAEFEVYRKEMRETVHALRNKMTDYEQRLYEIKMGNK